MLNFLGFLVLCGMVVCVACFAWWAGCGVWPWQRLFPNDKDVSIVAWWKWEKGED